MSESFPKPIKGPQSPKLNIEDLFRFGLLLGSARKGRDVALLAQELRLSKPVLKNWGEGLTLPGENLLLDIAQVYNLDLEKLKQAFDISQRAFGLEKNINYAAARKASKPPLGNPDFDFGPSKGGRIRTRGGSS